MRMLVKLSVENYKSFDTQEELTMLSSSKIQSHKDHRLKIKQTHILKHAVIYGANASGKSNMIETINFIKRVLLEGIPVDAINDFCRNKAVNKERESVFELQFTVGDKFYAYGFSAILSKRKITEEWLYELLQDGTANNLFIREANKSPKLGKQLKLDNDEHNRFNVYADDFVGHETSLFLAEMNRGKRYKEKSKLTFFYKVYHWLIYNIVIIKPNVGISNTDMYYTAESLDNISKLIKTFDTGVTEVKTKIISLDEMSKMIPSEILNNIFAHIRGDMQRKNSKQAKLTWRFDKGFFNIHIKENAEPEVTTLVLKHGKSVFDFNFADESDGTRRLFDLIDMLMTKQNDIVFMVDELERSLHPKLTEHFLKNFITAHENTRIQLIFTTHEDTIMDQEIFRRDEIWFIERNADNASQIYSLDKFKERYDKKLSKAYLEGRYGAIPVFKQFECEEEA